MRVFMMLLLCLISLDSFAGKEPKKPSVIIFLTDDQASNTMFIMEETTRILGKKGVTFSNSFPDNNLCCPSRATWQTGQVSHNHGVLDNNPPDGGYRVFSRREDNALPVWLKANGYRTGWIGKYMNGYPDPEGNPHVPPGWDDWQVFADSDSDFYYDYSLNENGALVYYGNAPEDYGTDVIRDKALNFIRESVAANKPYVLFIAVHAPHTPSTPAPRHEGQLAGVQLPVPPDFNEPDFSDKPLLLQQGLPQLSQGKVNELPDIWQRQLECLLAVDELVVDTTNLVTELKKQKDTYYVYTTDNGFFMGSKRTIGKRLAYEEGIHIPLVIRGPGVAKNKTLPNLVNNVDVVATILDWTKTTAGNVLDGKAMTALLSDSSTPWRSAILLEAQYEFFSGTPHYSAVRSASDIYIESTSEEFGVESEYYDLSTDPYQLDSINTPSDRKSYLSGLLRGLQDCVGESCFVP